jgi:hypothetical protein
MAEGARANRHGAPVDLTVRDRTVRVTSPEKVYFPERGFTKLDVARYYLAVGEGITRALFDRPTTLERYPEGVTGESFFQKRAPRYLPEWIPTGRIQFPSGRHADEMCPTEPAAVLWAANLGCLTFHPWPVRRGDLDHPDELRIDLDPQPGTGYPGPRRRPPSCAGCWTSWGCAAGRRPPAAAACTSSCRSCRSGGSPRCGGPRSRSRASWNGGCRSG